MTAAPATGYDPRFCCPTCGRAPLPLDYAATYPSKKPEEWENRQRRYYDDLAARHGRLAAGASERCINNHSWVVPAYGPGEMLR